jgi:hypothetical protein
MESFADVACRPGYSKRRPTTKAQAVNRTGGDFGARLSTCPPVGQTADSCFHSTCCAQAKHDHSRHLDVVAFRPAG